MPLTTYQELGTAVQNSGGSIRESLLDFIENVSPDDTPLLNSLSSMQVTSGFIQYLEDVLDTRNHNAQVEAFGATDPGLTTPARNFSIVQTFAKFYQVSGRQQAVRHAGLSNMLSYQETKKLTEMATDIEHALHRGSAVSGTAAVAAQLKGLLNALTTNFTASSGTTLTETVFNDLVTLAYNHNIKVREWYGNILAKRTLNNFSQNNVRYIPASDRRQLNVIEVYESEVGPIALFKSRDQLQAANKTSQGNSWVAIDPDKFNVGWLRQPMVKELGLDGDRTRKFAVAEGTLIVRSEKAGIGATGHVAYIP